MVLGQHASNTIHWKAEVDSWLWVVKVMAAFSENTNIHFPQKMVPDNPQVKIPQAYLKIMVFQKWTIFEIFHRIF